MKKSEKHRLENCDPGLIGDAIDVVGKSFEIEYDLDELQAVKTFGEYCDLVMASIKREHREGCTAQQGFYKLRAAIARVSLAEGTGRVSREDGMGRVDAIRSGMDATRTSAATITPATRMDNLIPAWGRQKKVRALQQELGIGMLLLDLKRGVGWTLFGCYLIAFLGIFINWRYGLAGLGLCMGINKLMWGVANHFRYETVGDVARVYALNYYRRARRDPETVNRDEIVPVIKRIFQRVLHLDAEVLTRDAVFKQ